MWTQMIAAESEPFSDSELVRIAEITKVVGREMVEAASKSDVLLRHVRGLSGREADDAAASLKEVMEWIEKDE